MMMRKSMLGIVVMLMVFAPIGQSEAKSLGQSTAIVSDGADLAIFALSVISTLIWISLRRDKRKRSIVERQLEKKPYSTSQKFGIVGILFFMLPIFWAVGVMLQKGAFVILILVLGILHLPAFLTMAVKAGFTFFAMLGLLIGVYMACEMMWPKRYEESVD